MINTERVILGDGEDCIYSADSTVTGLNNNILVIGTSGSGKTVSVIEAKLLETYCRSLIVTVTKRRIVKKYFPVMQKRGYKVWDLNFVHPSMGNVGFDPLRCISSYADITFLARSIVLADPKKERSTADPYWDEGAVSLLSAEIAYVMMKKENATLGDVLTFHDNLKFEDRGSVITTSYDRYFEELDRTDPSCFAVTCYRSFCQLPIKTAACIFSTLNTMLNAIFTPELRQIFEMAEMVDFDELATRRTILFVTSSPVNSELNNFISIFYGNMFKELFEFAEEQPNGELPVHVDVAADDFATGCPVHMFDNYISIFREKGLSATLLIQSESQLGSLYGSDKATTIINNCDTIVYLGSMDLNTAKDISLRANCLLEEILYMPLAQEILLRRGQRPIFTKRYNIKENEVYRKITKEYEENIAEQEHKK